MIDFREFSPMTNWNTNCSSTDHWTEICINSIQIFQTREIIMQGPLRGILAGAAAWKFGGGIISTILIFILVFWLLGHC